MGDGESVAVMVETVNGCGGRGRRHGRGERGGMGEAGGLSAG